MTTLPSDAVLSAVVRHLEQREDLAVVWLYGSRARGDHSPESDYDIAISLNNFESTYSQRRLTPEIIAMELSAELGKSIQIVDINLVPTTLAINIIDDGVVLVIKDELRYCRDLNRTYGLWEDHCWYKEHLS